MLPGRPLPKGVPNRCYDLLFVLCHSMLAASQVFVDQTSVVSHYVRLLSRGLCSEASHVCMWGLNGEISIINTAVLQKEDYSVFTSIRKDRLCPTSAHGGSRSMVPILYEYQSLGQFEKKYRMFSGNVFNRRQTTEHDALYFRFTNTNFF